MTETLTAIREFYWANRDVIRIAAGAGAVLLMQTVLVVWALRRLRELGHLRERLSRLADGLALLTDTTDAGLTTLIREIERLNARRQPQPAKKPQPRARRVPAARPTAAANVAGAAERYDAPSRPALADAFARSAHPVIAAGSDHLRQGYGGSPKPGARAEDPALLRF
jgi:hypothetical protein